MKKFFIHIHKITGSVLSLLFLMWCFSGVILLYKGFPHATRQDRFEKLKFLNENDFINLPFFEETNSGEIELEKYHENLVYRKYKGHKAQKIYDAQTLTEYKTFSKADAVKEAEYYLGDKVVKVDSVTKINSWIPWGYYEPLLPFYKCNMADEKRTVVFISSKTGTVIQHTNRYSRWMARLGAIPHLMYFPQIKQYAKRWKNTILVLGLIGILVAVSGLVVAFFRLKRDKAGKIFSITVYKKWIYKWHHVFGLFIGVFFFTFLLSGIFYATGVPSWISAKPEGKSPQSIWNQRFETDGTMHPVRIWKLLPVKSGLHKIAWNTAMGLPVIEAYYDNYKRPVIYIAANDTLIQFSTTEEKIKNYAIETLSSKNFSIEIQEEYDNYYKSSGMYYHSLPAYKLSFNNEFNTILYIDPQSGQAIEYFHNNKKAQRWLIRGLHKINFSFFNNVEWLRKTILIILCVGGFVVSLTGIILSWKWLRRGFKKRNNKNKKQKNEMKQTMSDPEASGLRRTTTIIKLCAK